LVLKSPRRVLCRLMIVVGGGVSQTLCVWGGGVGVGSVWGRVWGVGLCGFVLFCCVCRFVSY
jgi:hypothetical protein